MRTQFKGERSSSIIWYIKFFRNGDCSTFRTAALDLSTMSSTASGVLKRFCCRSLVSMYKNLQFAPMHGSLETPAGFGTIKPINVPRIITG